MTHVFAQEPLGQIGGPPGTGLGLFSEFTSAGTALGAVAKIVSTIVGVLTIAGFIWFLFQFLIGGFSWITAGGDKAKLQSARDRLTNAFIGLIVLIAGVAILALAGQFFGVDFLLTEPDNVIQNLTQ